MSTKAESGHRIEEDLVGKMLKFEIEPDCDGLPTIDGELLRELAEINFLARAGDKAIVTITGYATDDNGAQIENGKGGVKRITKQFIVEGTLLVKLLNKTGEKVDVMAEDFDKDKEM